MIKNISIVGGDLRNAYLAKMMSNQNRKVYLYGFEKEKNITKDDNVIKVDTLDEIINNSETIISSIPFSKDKQIINMPFSFNEIKIEKFFEIIKDKTLIAGSIDEKSLNLAKYYNVKTIDLMKMEDITIYNTIATAEGTIQIAMVETNRTIYNSNILVLGFGRVGKTVAERFYGLKANVYCEARKEEDIAWIKVYGYKPIWLNELDENLNKFDIIINTIPEKVINQKQLKLIRNDCLIIDLASNPGGVDFEKAQKIGIKVIHALGLPGKVAPYTSTSIVKDKIEKII